MAIRARLVGLSLLLAACSGGAAPPDDGGAADGGAAADLAASADTWSSFASGFFQSYCVSCHSPTGSDASGGKDFTKLASVQANAQTIRCGVAVAQDPSWGCAAFPPPRQFPICASPCTNAMPTDAERDRLVAWIGAGLAP